MMPPTISILQRRRIVRAVQRLMLAYAARAVTLNGPQPDNHRDIERELELARAAFQRALGPK